MPTEKSIYKIIKGAGYEPIENKGIIVKYAPGDSLSSKLASFFTLEYYVLHLCTDEIVMIPIKPLMAGGVKDEIALRLPYSTIQSVAITKEGVNYQIVLTTDTDTIRLSAQQKGMSEFRSSGALTTGVGFLNVGILGAATSDFKSMNWHRQNLDDTLSMLQNLPVVS